MSLRVLVTGLVQGVFFRKETVRVARGLGLTGLVRNLPDGSVEVFVAGPSKDVEELVLWLRHGPSEAHVTDLKASQLNDAQRAEIDKIGAGNFIQK